MNKIGVVIGFMVLLGIGGAVAFNKNSMKNQKIQNAENTAMVSDAPTAASQQITPVNAETIHTTSAVLPSISSNNADLDTTSQKELDQLDQDISVGSKDSLNDSDFSF